MLEQEKEPLMCYECDAEFVVHTPYSDGDQVSFCPFCGAEMEGDDLDEITDDDFEDFEE